jgi:hypothetical protein
LILFLFDEDLPLGKSFDDFMALLDEVEVVLIFLTPSYKEKINEVDSGVHKEFSWIWKRYNELKDLQRSGKQSPNKIPFEIIPVLFSGSPETSIPEELKDLKYSNLIGLRINRNHSGKFVVTEQNKKNTPAISTKS